MAGNSRLDSQGNRRFDVVNDKMPEISDEILPFRFSFCKNLNIVLEKHGNIHVQIPCGNDKDAGKNICLKL